MKISTTRRRKLVVFIQDHVLPSLRPADHTSPSGSGTSRLIRLAGHYRVLGRRWNTTEAAWFMDELAQSTAIYEPATSEDDADGGHHPAAGLATRRRRRRRLTSRVSRRFSSGSSNTLFNCRRRRRISGWPTGQNLLGHNPLLCCHTGVG